MLLTTELDKLSATNWQLFFAQERAKPYFAELDAFVTAAAAEKNRLPRGGKYICRIAAPARYRRCGSSFWGRTPTIEPGQAMGLSSLVPDGCKAPPSLRNIFKELEAELGPGCAAHTDLTLWARAGCAAAEHGADRGAGRGQRPCGPRVGDVYPCRAGIRRRSRHRPAGRRAVGQARAEVRTDFQPGCRPSPGAGAGLAHPSPLSAYRGFFGSAPFGKVNAFLKNNGAAEIDWRLPANATHGSQIDGVTVWCATGEFGKIRSEKFPKTRRGGLVHRQPLTGAYRMRPYDCHKAAKEEAHHDIFR